MAIRFRHTLLLIVVVGGLLRLVTLGERSLWLDELTSLQVSSQPLATIAAGDAFDNHTPPLYYLLLHLWWWLVPQSEFWLRLPSLLVDLVNIALVGVVFSHQFSRRVGLAAAAIFAVSEYALYYGQEGRMYSLACCLALASYGLALVFRDGRDTPWTWIVAAAVAVGGLYAHYFNALLLIALTAGLILDRWSEPRRWLRWCGVMAVAAFAFLPWLDIVLGLAGQGGQPFRSFVWLVPPYTLFRWVAGYAVFPLNCGSKVDWLQSVIANLPVVVAYLGVFGALVVVGLRRLLRDHRRQAMLLLVLLAVPALLGLAISLASPMLSERYLIVSFPMFSALLALAVTGPEPGVSERLLRVAAAGLMAWALAQHFLSPAFGNTQWRQSVEYLQSAARPDVPVYVHPGYARDMVAHYSGPELEVVRLTDDARRRLVEAPSARQTDPRPRELWLVERGNVPSVAGDLVGVGYRITGERLFELRNGVRVFHLELMVAGGDAKDVMMTPESESEGRPLESR